MADVDITSLSVEISAESHGAELNIDKLATAISNLRTKGNVTKVVNSLDKLAGSIATLKQASAGMSGLDKITSFLNGLSNVNATASTKSINTVVNAIKKIPAAVSGLNGVDFYSMSGSITQLTNALAPLSILDASNLKALGSAFNAIGKVPDLTDKLKATDLDSFASSCQKISTALTPLASQLDKVGNAFAKLPPQLSKVVTQTNRVTAANEKQRKSYLGLSNQMNGFMRNMAKLVSLKAIADYLGNAVGKFNDFYEAANMFGVSMGDMTNEASGFIDKMEQLLGIDPSEAMNATANIYSMTKSFGLAKDQAYTLSKSLTQLGYDLSSLKNIPISQAFTKIRSAMAGELEPMLQLGVDISQARLQQELLELGFNKQVSTLSQADKTTLRYIAILKQTTDAQGDFARTLSSPANMIRVLKAQLSGLARDIGSLLYPALKSILPPLIAAVELIREFVQWVAKLMGVKVVLTDFAKSADSVGGIGDAMDDTADSTKKAAKALKDYTMGFDELNIIDPTQGSSGSGSGTSAGNILGDVDLSGYDMFKNYVGNAVDEIKAKLEKLAPLIAGISAGFATWAIGNALLEALNKIKGDGSLIEGILKLWKSPIMGAAVAVGIMAARFVDLYQNSEAFRKGLERVRAMIYLAAEGLKQGWNISLTDGKLGESIKYLKESFPNLKQVIWNLIPESWQDSISSAFKTISDVVKDLDLDVGDLITTLMGIGLIVSGHPVAGLAVLGFEAITVAVRGLGSESQKESFEMETDWFNAFKSMGEKVADFVGDAITAIGNLINDFAIFIGWIQNGVSETEMLDIQMNGNFLEGAIASLAQVIHDIGTFIGWITKGVDESDRMNIAMNGNLLEKGVLGFADLINGIKSAIDWFVSLPDPITAAGDAIGTFLATAKEWAEKAGNLASNVLSTLQSKSSEWLSTGAQWVKNLVSGISQKIEDAKSKAGEVITTVKGVFEGLNLFDIGKNLIRGFVDGINNMIETAKNAVANVGNAVIDKVKNTLGIHSPSTVFAEIGDFLMQGLVQGVENAKDYVNTAFNVMGAQAVNAAATGLGLNTGAFNAMGQAAAAQTAQGMSEQAPSVAGLFNSAATYFGVNFWTGLDDTWKEINKNIQTDAIGSIQTLFTAIKNGDLSSIAKWSASYFYVHLSAEQKAQIQAFAQSALLKLSSSLSGVFANLSSLASGFVGMFVPAAGSATVAQGALNTAMDANPIMLVISLIGMLVGALINFSGTNTDVGTSFKKVWINIKIFFSYIVEGIVGLVAVMIQGFINQINAAIWVYNKAVGLFGGKQVGYVQNPATVAIDSIEKQRKEWKNELANLKNEKVDITGDTTDYDKKYNELLKDMQDRMDSLAKGTGGLESPDVNSTYKQQIDALQKQLERLRSSIGTTSGSTTSPSWNHDTASNGSTSSYNPSNYPGTKEWDKNNGSWSSGATSGGYTTVKVDEEEMRESVYNGTYNAFLDIFQRYGNELTGGKEFKIYLDGKQLTASIEKTQNSRGRSLMGSEVYSY